MLETANNYYNFIFNEISNACKATRKRESELPIVSRMGKMQLVLAYRTEEIVCSGTLSILQARDFYMRFRLIF